jgi:hypothetical protein
MATLTAANQHMETLQAMLNVVVCHLLTPARHR